MNFSVRGQIVSSLTLIGMPGVGKSSLGKMFSKRYGFSFLDTDDVLTDSFQMNLESYIQSEGLEAFKRKERDVLVSISPTIQTVIGTGGSVVYSSEAMEHLQSFSIIMYMSDRLSRISSRIPNLHTRGIVGLGSGGLATLFSERKPLYEKYADVTFEMEGNFHPKRFSEQMKMALEPFMTTIPVEEMQ